MVKNPKQILAFCTSQLFLAEFDYFFLSERFNFLVKTSASALFICSDTTYLTYSVDIYSICNCSQC